MNKTAIKNFAVKARRKLIEEISHKAYGIGITKDHILGIETFEGGFRVEGRENGQTFKKYELKQRDRLIDRIKAQGFEQVIEEVAYTWFNRFIALRFMEVNNYLPTGVRVLSSVEEGKTEPDIIREADGIDLDVDLKIIYRLQDSNDTEGLYKYLLVRQCNQLGKIMPSVFEEIADYTELLLPDKLLAEGSVSRELVEGIGEGDWKAQVEIIGWLYQYYISEKKDEVFAGLRKNKKITKENIPAATQLFTPKWIVKYMVENSLGRLWLERLDASGQLATGDELKKNWKYYLDEAEQEPEVDEGLKKIRASYKKMMPEDIKILDPAMGSGHILVYAFDLLYEIYLSVGYSEREIPTLILEKNLYGLDVCDRAGQLASFALLMKARSKNRRIFRSKPKLNLCAIQESNLRVEKSEKTSMVGLKEITEYFALKDDLEYLLEVFHDVKEYGSILDVKGIDFDALENRIEEIKDSTPRDIFEQQCREVILEKVPPLIEQARIMSQKYDVVCTNPPYMGRRGMNPKLIEHLDRNFKDSKTDLFAVFMELDNIYLKKNGFWGMINQHSWMFLSSYEKLRERIINNRTIYNMVHLGPHAFEEIGGEVVQSTSFIIRKIRFANYNGTYIKVTDHKDAKEKKCKLLDAVKDVTVCNRYVLGVKEFVKMPGKPIAYWVNEKIVQSFDFESYKKKIKAVKGLDTCDNERFVREWHEANFGRIGYEIVTVSDTYQYKWYPYCKGGGFRKWYGLNDKVVNWEKDGLELRNFRNDDGSIKSRPQNIRYYFNEGLTWSTITSHRLSVRYMSNSIFGGGGSAIFTKENLYYILAFLNSKVVDFHLRLINPTLNFLVGDILNLPCKFSSVNDIEMIARLNITTSKTDWDSFETSWDFKTHPFLKDLDLGENYRLSNIFTIWETETEEAFNQLKSNEEELNRIFIEIYGLQDELSPEVEDKDITIRKADRERDIKSFISYAVGCMFGRYSLDEEGLIYAGGDFDDRFRKENGSWEVKTKEGWKWSTIKIAEHNIIPIAKGDYFEDGMLERFVEFLRVSFGEETLEVNLDYIAETLGRRITETPRQAIRRYFISDFYKDHVRIYKKRPIYWLFNSGRRNGFKALIYMHRYDPFTVARVRTDYLHSLQKKYEGEIDHLDILIDSEISDREKAKARKSKEKILKQIKECRLYDEVIAHVANQKIDIDLDDGVKVNYAKFQAVQIPQGEGKKPLKADLLGRI